MKGSCFWVNLEDRVDIIDLEVDDILMNTMCEYDLSRAELS
jgi:hypothetical protein